MRYVSFEVGYAARHDLGTSNSEDRIVYLFGLGVAVMVGDGRRVLVGFGVLVSEGLDWVKVFTDNSVGVTV